MSEETSFVNVLLLGGKGKYRFIDLFANYLKHENLSSDMKPITPNNIFGTSSKVVADYIFDVKNVKLRLIDTPDFPYCKQTPAQILNRSKNLDIMKNIICNIAKYGHMNAIAIVTESSMELIEDIIEYVLPHFDKSMCQNVMFIYEGHQSSYNANRIEMQRFLKNIPEEISCFKQNTFITNGLFFSYLRYLQPNSAHFRELYKEEDWQEDRICCKNFIDYIVGHEKSTGLMPHFIKPVKDDFDELFRFLADSACALSENSKILLKQHGSHNYFSFKKSSLISLVKATTTGKSVNICKSARCTEFQKKVSDVSQNFCEYANSTKLYCSCGCPMNMHYSAKYSMKLPHQTNYNTINPRHNYSNLDNGITFASIQKELNEVLDSLVTVSIYKIQRYKLTEDPFASYLDNYTHVDQNNLKELYYGRKQGKETTTITLQDISKCMEQLKILNWMGRTLKDIYGDDFNIETEIAIENQLKTIQKSAELQSTTQKLLHKNVTTKPCSLQNTMNIPISFKNEIKVVETPTVSKMKPKEPLERNHIQLQQVQEAIDKIQQHSVQRSNSTYGMLGNIQYGLYNADGTNIQKPTAEQIVINQGLTNEIKLLKQQNNELLEQQKIVNAQNTKLEQTIKSIHTELNSIRADTAKNQVLINKIENNKQENISKQAGLTNEYTRTVGILEKAFNKHVVQAENQQILNNQVKQQVDNLQDATKKLKRELSDITQASIHPINQRVNNLHVGIEKLKESIQLTNNSNVSQDKNHQALINQRIDNLCDYMKIVKQSMKQLSDITLIEDRPINQRINNLHDDITNIKEFMQDLSNEIKEIKQQLITNVELEQQSTSGVQAETLQRNQEVSEEQPKKFQKLIEDINNLKKIKEMQECDEEINVEGQEDNAEGETSQSAQPKFQKLIEDLSNLKKLKERKDPNENNEVMCEVKRITGQQENISKQLEDLKVFIKDTLANKQNG